ncbi:hypothetical protein BpHYR1_050892 [Brachionus plicatilis]|uniref:Uncharacterized protein n=1 Tax=Brachionus plicatilis TaxID=10195 RepID=A0A3M7RDP9_BRAPC|nr:hypothetical protein BpHYR1_050892 [Brachionus plicatilis]
MGQMTPILPILHSKHLKVYSHLTPFDASICLAGIGLIKRVNITRLGLLIVDKNNKSPRIT